MNYTYHLFMLIMLVTLPLWSQAQNTYKRFVESEEIQALTQDTYFNVKICDFIFKKLDHNKRLVEFTPLDIVKLEQYFMAKAGVLTCSSHVLDKNVKVVSKMYDNGLPAFDHYKVVEELHQMGFAVLTLHTAIDRMLFSTKSMTNLANGDDCNDCGKVKLSDNLLDKFKEEDYGGNELINFDFNPPSMAIDTTFTTSDN